MNWGRARPVCRPGGSGGSPRWRLCCPAMPPPPIWLLPTLAALVAVGLPLYAFKVRGRTYAIFALVLVLFSFPGSLFLASDAVAGAPPPSKSAIAWLFVYGMLATSQLLSKTSLKPCRHDPGRFTMRGNPDARPTTRRQP